MRYIKLLWELSRLKRNTSKTKQQIKDLQKKKLYQLLVYAYDHSTYYRTAFLKAGITRESICSTPISKFPVMNKKLLMEHYDELVTVDDVKQEELRIFDEQDDLEENFKNGYHVVHSSGSTGKPCYFIYDEAAWHQMLLAMIRGALWGMSMMEVLHLLWKRPRIVYIAATDGRYGGAMAVGSGIQGVHAKQLSLDIKQPLHEWVDHIQNFDPAIMIGYSSALKILAELAEEGKVSLHMERIISCGEPLSTNLRKYLSRVFHCEIVNFYGASESLALGVEVHEEEGMYLFEDMNLIEEENGKMYLTSLYNYAQPLIRYELCDHIVWHEGESQYPFSRIKSISGRNEDLMWFIDNDGKKEFLHPLAMEGFCIDGMLDYQFIQRDDRSFELHIEVLEEHRKEIIIQKMDTALKKILEEKKMEYVDFNIQFVDEILPDQKTGKKQLVIQQKGADI